MSSVYSLFDLVTMFAGIQVLKNPPSNAKSGRDFWTVPSNDGTREARELTWFWDSQSNPFLGRSRYRGWIATQLMESMTDSDRPLVTFPAENLHITDLLESHIFPDMPGASAYTRAFTKPKDSSYLHHFRTSLVAGFAHTHLPEGPVIAFGAGLRRQTKLHKTGLAHEALKFDLEMYVPFYLGTEDFEAIPSDRKIPAECCAIQLGMAISREGQALGGNDLLQMAGIRYSVSIPVQLPWGETETPAKSWGLGEAIYRIETLPLPPSGSTQVSWEEVSDQETWRNITQALLASADGKALAMAPIGPITAQPIDRDSVLEVLKNGLGPIKEGVKDSIEAWGEAKAFLESFLQYGRVPKPPEKEGDPPDISNLRSIGSFLKTLRLIKENDDKKLVVANLDDLSIWHLLNLLAGELDGLPLWLKGIDPKDQADHQGPPIPPVNVAIQLASAARMGDPSTHFFGIRGMGFNIPKRKPTGVEDKRDLEIMLHFGKFFSKENRESNWISRLEPLQADGKTPAPSRLPGIGIYPLTVSLPHQNHPIDPRVRPNWGLRIDLASLGIDFRGRNDLGLVDTPFFKLGGMEFRFFLSVDWVAGQKLPHTLFGLGAKFTDIRILTKRDKKKEDDSDEDDIYAGLVELFAEEEDKKETKPKTRLADSVKDNFSLSLGYMTGITDLHDPTFDAQLYNAKGKPGKTIWIAFEREKNHLYLKSIGLRLKGMNNVVLKDGAFGKKAKLAILLTGGLRFANFELGFIGAGLNIPLGKVQEPEFELEGLDVSIKAGPAVISGSFLKIDKEFAGHVKVQLPSFSFAAMGAFGKTQEGETTLFIYGALNFANGFGGAAFRLTGLAFGLGINRRVIIPQVDEVAAFPLVQMVMGKGGLPEDTQKSADPRKSLGSPMEKPLDVLATMSSKLKAETGQNFGALGLRFTLAETVDCFALGILQFGNELEISLLGLARMKLPKGADGSEDAPVICYAELQLAATLKPDAGIFKIEAVLTDNSWVFHPSCRLTGGFAVYVWFDGEHKGDFVITLGGYHPRFSRPSHYPVIPRIGVRWPVSDNLLIKGGLYFALTPSCGMIGGSLEAAFKTQRIRASFHLYLNLVVEWNPLFFELEVGIGINVEADLVLFSISLSLNISMIVWGPPFGGIATVDLDIFSFDIPFGSSRQEAVPDTIGTWQEFLNSVLLPPDQVETSDVIPQLGMNIARGQRSPIQGQDQETQTKEPARVSPDELVLTLSSTIPATQLQLGQLSRDTIKSLPTNTGQKTIPINNALQFTQANRTEQGADVRVRPMDADLTSAMKLAVIHEDANQCLDLSDWSLAPTRSSLPGAIWDPDAPKQAADRKPDARLIEGCITGIQAIRPPLGTITQGINRAIEPKDLGWNRLPQHTVASMPKPPESHIPAPHGKALDTALAAKKAAHQASTKALQELGFAI